MEVCATIMRLNFGIEVSKAAGWLSFKRCNFKLFTFSPYNFYDNHLTDSLPYHVYVQCVGARVVLLMMVMVVMVMVRMMQLHSQW